jgi:glycosyltransferase involved in cell wall biosynthesis
LDKSERKMRMGVSVLVPVYNGQKYLEEFLRSLFDQTYRPIEVIIGDDASTDKSMEICRRWRDENDNVEFRIKIIESAKNRGLTANIAEIIKNASYEYIAFADQDDVWDRRKLQLQVDYMEQCPECNVCLCDRSITDENLGVKIQSEHELKNYKKKKLTFEEAIKHTGCYAANTMLIRGNINGVLDIPPGIVCYDIYMAIIASVTGTVDYINKQLVLYRIHGGNLSNNFKAETSRSFLSLFVRRYVSYIKGRDKYNRDGEIISQEIKNRYGIDLAKYENRLLKSQRGEWFLLSIFKECIRDYRNGKIGIWC